MPNLKKTTKLTLKPVLNARPRQVGPVGTNQAWLVRQSNLWRANYDPLRGLNLPRAVFLLEQGQRGQMTELQWLYRFVEKRYSVLRGLIMRRRSALVKLDWDIKIADTVKPGDKSLVALAQRQRKFLKSRYSAISNFKEAIRQLALAEFRGFAVLNKHRYEGGVYDGGVAELHWLPQWNFVKDGLEGDWFWNPESESGATADSLGEANRLVREEGGYYSDFIIRETEMPINEIGLIAFIRSALSQKDWDAFVEIYGLTGCVVVLPANIPAGREIEYQFAAEKIAEGGSGALPNGGDAKFPGAVVRDNSPFKIHLEWQEKDVVLAGTGGKLTMLTEATGMNSNQAGVHADAFDQVATAEAAEISEVFQSQFDRYELAMEFPGEPALVYFELCPEDTTANTRKKFKEDVVRGMIGNKTLCSIVANQTNLKQLARDVELPINEAYKAPYVPVTTSTGAVVSGQLVRDTEGNVIGAATETKARAPLKKALNRVANYDEIFSAVFADDLAEAQQKLSTVLKIKDRTVYSQKLEEMASYSEKLRSDIQQLPKEQQPEAMVKAQKLLDAIIKLKSEII